MGNNPYYVAEVTIRVRVRPTENAYPAQWDWPTLLDCDPDDLHVGKVRVVDKLQPTGDEHEDRT